VPMYNGYVTNAHYGIVNRLKLLKVKISFFYEGG